jgi:ribosomal subunit interface protein
MDIIIQAKEFKIGNSLHAFITDKVGKLYSKCKNIIRTEVILRQGGYGEIENKLCEIRLLVPGNDHIVKVNSTVYQKSILKAVNVLEKILRRNKTKVISRRHLIPN